MIATFVGGPRHGNHQSMEHTPLTVDMDKTDGTQMQYKRRVVSAADMQQQRIIVQVFYAPPQMPNKEFMRLRRTLCVPSDR